MLRRAVLRGLGVGVMGGLPLRRVDQQYVEHPPALGAGSRTGNLRARSLVLFGTGNGIGWFEYNGAPAGPTPGPANPPIAWAVPPGVSKDPFGNTLPQAGGVVSASSLAFSQLNGGNVVVGDVSPAGVNPQPSSLFSGDTVNDGNLFITSGKANGTDTAALLNLLSSAASPGVLVVTSTSAPRSTTALLEVQGGFAAGSGTKFEIWLLPSGDTTGVKDSAAITAAFLVASAVHLLPGVFYVNASVIMKGPQQLSGAGPGITTIKTVAAANQYNVIATADSAAAGFTSSHGVIKGLTIDCAGMAGGAASNGNGNGLYLFGAIEWLVEDVEIINSPNWGIVLDSNANNDCFWTWLHRVNLGTGTQANAGGLLNGYNTNSRITECVLAAKSVATVAALQPKYTPAPANTGGVVLSNSADPKYTNNILGKGGSTIATVAITNIGNHFIGNYFLNSDTSVINDVAGNTIIDGNQFDQCVLVTAAPLIQLNGSKSNPVTLTGNVQSQGAGLSTWAVQGSGLVKMLSNALVAGSTGLTSIEGGDSWNRVSAAGQPAFGVNWSNFGGGFAALGFRLVAGPPRTVQIIGTVTAAVGAGVTIFTLPADYAPASNHQFCITQLNPATNWLEVLTSGAVNVHAATTGTFSIEVVLSLDA